MGRSEVGLSVHRPRIPIRNIDPKMNRCPFYDQIVFRPIVQAVEAANGEVVVLVSCPACFSILGVTRRADLAIS